ncbi:hypothetical protein GCM10009530_35080 [Microbispora corallina]|uniref:Uncharacterized protein n=1 Tax=Microbispora corallina TaxID=83302 RepID=A0ABQ4FYQ3_9ACTN|nr:hypothetical protein Mco01_29560 [Microbispora corallina]
MELAEHGGARHLIDRELFPEILLHAFHNPQDGLRYYVVHCSSCASEAPAEFDGNQSAIGRDRTVTVCTCMANLLAGAGSTRIRGQFRAESTGFVADAG